MTKDPLHEDGHAATPTRLEVIGRTGYLVIAVALVFAIIVQVFLAGAGVLSDPGYLAHHVSLVEWFQTFPVFLLIAAFVGKMPRTAKVLPIATWIGFYLQYQFIGLRPSLTAGLHTVNALLIFWLTLRMVDQGRKSRSRNAAVKGDGKGKSAASRQGIP